MGVCVRRENTFREGFQLYVCVSLEVIVWIAIGRLRERQTGGKLQRTADTTEDHPAEYTCITQEIILKIRGDWSIL